MEQLLTALTGAGSFSIHMTDIRHQPGALRIICILLYLKWDSRMRWGSEVDILRRIVKLLRVAGVRRHWARAAYRGRRHCCCFSKRGESPRACEQENEKINDRHVSGLAPGARLWHECWERPLRSPECTITQADTRPRLHDLRQQGCVLFFLKHNQPVMSI